MALYTNKNAGGVNVLITVGAVTYIGKESENGAWCFISLDETTDVVLTYATQRNNTDITTYAAALAHPYNTLTYSTYATAF